MKCKLSIQEKLKDLRIEKGLSLQELSEQTGISRSSFYKYKDDIYEFHDSLQGNTYTLTFQMNDEPGLLSDVLAIIAASGANILTIHQSIPIDGVATLSISLQVLDRAGSVEEMAASIEKKDGVRKVQISGRGINIS